MPLNNGNHLVGTLSGGNTLSGRLDGNTADYGLLSNKPKINGVVVVGDKSIEDYGVNTMTNTEILKTFNRVFNGG